VALFRQVAPSRGFPGAVPYGVRTFLAPVLCTGARPSGQPEDIGIIPLDGRGVNLVQEKRTENREERTGEKGSGNQGRRDQAIREQVTRKHATRDQVIRE